jgi:spermidine synthase
MYNLEGRSRIYLVGAAFGAAALIVQTEFLRAVMESTAGGTLAVGAALGAWLISIAAGALLGGRLSASRAGGQSLAFVFSALALPCGLFLIFAVGALRFWLHTPAGEVVPFFSLAWMSLTGCAPFALLVGMTFPLLAALALKAGEPVLLPSSALFIGGLWAAEAAGAFLAGLLFTFVLSGRTGPVFNVALGSSLPLAAAVLIRLLHGRAGRLISAASISVLILVLLFTPLLERTFTSLRWQGLGAPGELLASTWTRYRSLFLGRLADQTTLYDNGEPALSFPDPYANAAQTALLLSQRQTPGRVLVVGPSAGGLAQALLSAGAEEVVSVYPDRRLEEELTGHLPDVLLEPLKSGRYNYVQADARAWLGRPPARIRAGRPASWDLILVNLPGPAHMDAARFYTPGFFRRAGRAFSPAGGLLVLRLPAAANYSLPAQSDQAAAVWASLRASFRFLALAENSTEIYLFATDREGLLSENPDTLTARVSRFEGRVPNLTRYLVPTFYDSTRIAPLRRSLDRLSRQTVPHTDIAPVAWLHYLRLWARISGGGKEPGLLERFLDAAAGIRARSVIPLPSLIVCLCLSLVLFFASRRGTGGRAVGQAAAISVAVVGFSAMGASVILLYLCQLVFGSLFWQVALITAVFMCALAAGSQHASARADLSRGGGRTVAGLAALLSLGVALCAVVPVLLEPLYESGSRAGEWLALALFYLTVAGVGLFAGMFFPWAAELHALEPSPPGAGRTAAALDFADHLGASLGALSVGVFMVPAWGILPVTGSLSLSLLCVAFFWLAVSKRNND